MAEIVAQARGRSKRIDSERELKPISVESIAKTNQINLAKESRPGLERLQATAQYAGEVLQGIDDERIKNKNAEDIAEINVKTTEFSKELLRQRATLTAEQFNDKREKFEVEMLKDYKDKYKNDSNGYEKFEFKSKVQNALTKQKLDLMSSYMDSVVKDSIIRLDKQKKRIDLMAIEGIKGMSPDMVIVFADNIEKTMLALEEEKFKLGMSRNSNIQQEIAEKKAQIYINSLVDRLSSKDAFYGVDDEGNPTEKDLSQLNKELSNDQYGKKQGWKWTNAEKEFIRKTINKLVDDQKEVHNRADLAHNNDFSTTTIDKALKIMDPIVTKHINPGFRSTIKDRQTKAIQELRNSIDISIFKGPNAKKRLNELIEVIDAIATGEDTSAPINYQVFSDIKNAILNGTLTSLGESMTVLGNKTPMMMIGNGISFAEYQQLNTLINTPSVLRKEKLIRDETATLVHGLWKNTGATDLSSSLLRKLKIQREVERLIKEGLDAGKTIKNLTDPLNTTGDYIDANFVITSDPKFRGTFDEVVQDSFTKNQLDYVRPKVAISAIVKNNRREKVNPNTFRTEYSYITTENQVKGIDKYEPLTEILAEIALNPIDNVYEFFVNIYGKEVAHDILNQPETKTLLKDKDGYGQNIQDFYNKTGNFSSKKSEPKLNIITAGKQPIKDDEEKV